MRHPRLILMKLTYRRIIKCRIQIWISYLFHKLMDKILIRNSIQTSILRIHLYLIMIHMLKLLRVKYHKLVWVNLEGRWVNWVNSINKANKPLVSAWTLKAPNANPKTNPNRLNLNSHRTNPSSPKTTTAFPCQITITAFGME